MTTSAAAEQHRGFSSEPAENRGHQPARRSPRAPGRAPRVDLGYDVSASRGTRAARGVRRSSRQPADRRPGADRGRTRTARHVRRHLRAVPQPAHRTRRTPTSGCTARASTSTPTCTRSTWSGRACRRRSGPSSLPALRNYGVNDLRARTGAGRRRSTGCSWLRNAPRTRSRSSPGCWSAGAPPSSPTADYQAAGEVVDRLVVATRLRYPVVGDLARSIRYEALRRAADRGARADLRRRPRTACNTSLTTPTRRTTRRGSRHWSQPGTADPTAGRTHFHGPGRRDARGDHAPVLPDPRAGGRQGLRTGRSAVRHRQFRTVRTAAASDLDHRRSRPAAAALLAVDTIAGPKPGNVVIDLYLSWPDAPADGDRLSTALHDSARRSTRAAVGAGSPSRVRRARERAAVHLPPGATRAGRGAGRSAACTR